MSETILMSSNDAKMFDTVNIGIFLLEISSVCVTHTHEIELIRYYTIIDFNEVDIRIYLPEKVIIHQDR